MILRIVSGRVPAGRLDAVVEAYRRDYVPIARQTVGLDRFLVAARLVPDGGHEFAAMTIWTSVEAALAAYDGNLAAARTLDGQGHGETLTRVDYYEIDAGGARRRTGAATRLRLTAGTVARGLDADIQQELRRHLPDLPVEAIEAYVGRRVLGGAVEIALVTTWSAAPAGVSLDAPLWPSIADRYDTFRIVVHDVLLDGAGAG
ncbi:MAG TPA: hypothetical protein VHM48_06290 [Candidatus Limnocylindrales bacterium]|nr:hypothetical protein [Candidatus Limnocylindrales bacterium]